jgi:ADP-heptose:LPS heptosyltransferase
LRVRILLHRTAHFKQSPGPRFPPAIILWDNRPSPEVKDGPEKLAEDFLTHHEATGRYLRDRITRLAELATDADPATAKAAAGAIFGSLVEPLADSFEPAAARLYERLFAQIIQFCRRTPRGADLDRALSKFGLESEEDLLARVSSLRHPSGFSPGRVAREIERVIIFSRVTLGADVAITSVLIERVKQMFPRAGLVLVGGRKASELFGGDARLSFRELDYERAGATLDRLLSWLDVLSVVEELSEGLDAREYLILDPDSRLTQLGLLPVSPSDNYLLFPSREYKAATSLSLGQLASDWLDEVFGEESPTLARLSLYPSDLGRAESVARRMRSGSARPVVAINFGVGENPLKRVSDEFERQLVGGLIESGALVILDKGAGRDEARRADMVIAHAASIAREGLPIRVTEVDEAGLSDLLASDWEGADLLVWSGRIGLLAALIGQSDLYIGYDSAGQHIAAALSVPCIDVFAGYTSKRMLDRWKPATGTWTRVIPVDAPEARADSRIILSEVLTSAREMIRINRRGFRPL